MEYKYNKELKEGTVVIYKGVPVALMNDVFVGTNTDLELTEEGEKQ